MPSPILGLRTCILAGLCLGASVRTAGDETAVQCKQSFYKEMPPLGLPGDQLQLVCHSSAGGRPFAALYDVSCGVDVLSAFSTRRAADEVDGGPKEAEEEDSQEDNLSAITSELASTSSNMHMQRWHSTMWRLVRGSFFPSCQSKGGDLYMITGTRGSQPCDKDSEAAALWSAVCCGTPSSDRGFSFAMLSEREGGVTVLSVGALEEVLGAGPLFPGGCDKVSEVGGGGELLEALQKQVMEIFSSSSEEHRDGAETAIPDLQSVGAGGTEPDLHSAGAGRTEPDLHSVGTGGTEPDLHSAGTGRTEPDLQSVGAGGTESEPPSNSEGDSITMYILSSSLSLLSAPFRPIVSTLSQIPGQMSYVVQEELGVLSALPADTFLVFNNLVCDAAWVVMSAGGLLISTGEYCASQIYACSAPLLEALVNSCTEGAAGVGALAGDGVGILGDIVDKGWSASTFVGGTACEQSKGYIYALTSELGTQMKRAGAGLGKLAVKGGRGVTHVFNTVGWLMGGAVDVALETMREVFGNE